MTTAAADTRVEDALSQSTLVLTRLRQALRLDAALLHRSQHVLAEARAALRESPPTARLVE